VVKLVNEVIAKAPELNLGLLLLGMPVLGNACGSAGKVFWCLADSHPKCRRKVGKPVPIDLPVKTVSSSSVKVGKACILWLRLGSVSLALIPIALAMHCGWDGQCIANAKPMHAGKRQTIARE
jgi:hypothetical protein